MHKKIIALSLIVVLMVSASILLFFNYGNRNVDCHIAELIDLVSARVMEEPWVSRRAQVLETPHLAPRFELLIDFWMLIHEVAFDQHMKTGHFPDGIIVGMSSPLRTPGGVFNIHLISEEYIAILDFIAYFIGIDREMITTRSDPFAYFRSKP